MSDLRQLLRTASRTFAIGIERLPGRLQAEVRTAYLLLRVSDYLEDNEEMAGDRKAVLLERWCGVLERTLTVEEFKADLGAIGSATPDAQVARQVEDVLAAFEALSQGAREVLERHVTDTTRGMARWALRGSDFATEDDLDDYMHEVAGRVGYLVTDLFALRSRTLDQRRAEMLRLGREFGLGLQTVNVIRGLHEDPDRGWFYVPRSFLPPGMETVTSLYEEGAEEAALEVVNRLAVKASRHMEDAVRYVERIPRRMHGVRTFCQLPLFFALRTLAVSRGSTQVLREEVKIGREQVRSIVSQTTVWGWSNRWTRRYASRLGEVRG